MVGSWYGTGQNIQAYRLGKSILKSNSTVTPLRALDCAGIPTKSGSWSQEVKTGVSGHGIADLGFASPYANYTRDITRYSTGNKVLRATHSYHHHAAIVNDVQYHLEHKFLIGTVSDDLTLQLIDTRKPMDKSVMKTMKAHTDAVNALSFCPTSEYVLATGSADKTIGIWDVRMLTSKVHALVGHQDAVTSLAWNPKKPAILGSAGYDRRILIWDLSRVGEEQTSEEAEDGPPEL